MQAQLSYDKAEGRLGGVLVIVHLEFILGSKIFQDISHV